MGIRPTNDPYGGINPLIDKLIGNAFDIVKYVAANLKVIRYVAENMQIIHDAANGITPTDPVNPGPTPGASNTIFQTISLNNQNSISVPMPAELTNPLALFGMSAVAFNSSGVHMPSTANYTISISYGNVVVRTHSSDFHNATFQIAFHLNPEAEIM